MKPRASESDYRQLSFWHDSLPAPQAARPALQGDIEADVAIIGAGYTGLWTAWYLKQAEPSLNVVILEAETAGFGASGRNGGWCSAFLSGIDHWLDDPLQRDSAIRLQRLMFETVAEIGRVAAQESIDCHFERSGALEVAVNPAQLERLQKELSHLRSLDFDESDFRWLEADEVRRELPVQGALSAIHTPHCAAIHPARLARGLAEKLESKGVRIFEHSQATDFSDGRVRTATGELHADTVLLATEGYGCGLPGRERSLIPVHSTMVATEPLSADRLDQLGSLRRYCFGNLDHVVTYGQLTADKRIAFGCRGIYLYGSGIRSRFAPEDPGFERVRGTLLRFFPSLEGVRFTHAWGGALGVSRSLRPMVCFDPARRLGWAGGYFGNGVAASHLAGRTLADLVSGRDSERVHTPWVNPPEASRKWEPEPLRWLGFSATRTLMELADRAEYRGYQRFGKAIDSLLP
ncbi:NAD(P)/FAD-dependent oxidoreductase [Pseudomonadota bacterium]